MRLLRRNILTTYAVYGATVLSGLVLTPVIVNSLGNEQYGVWSIAAALITYLALLDFGLGPTVVRHGAEYRGRRAPEETNALVSAGLVVYGAVGAVTLVVGGVVAWILPALLGLEGDLVGAARAATFLVVLGAVVRFPLGLFWNLLLAQQRYDLVNAGSLASIGLYTLLVLALVTRYEDIVVLAAASLAATVVRLALPLLWVRRELPFLRPRRALVTRRLVRDLLGFSSHNFLIQLSARAAFSTDVVVVGIVLGAEAAAFYAIPAKLFQLAFGLGTGATNLLYPAFAELEGAEDVERQRAYLRAGIRAGMALMLAFAVPLVLVPDLLIRAWIGDGYDESTAVAVLLGLTLLLHQPIHVCGQFLIARRLQAPLARVLVGTVTANVVLSVALALAVGLWGVAASALATTALAVALVPRLVSRASGLSTPALARLALRPLVPAFLLGAIVFLPVRALGLDELASLAPVGAAWLVACGLALWRFGFGAKERTALGSRFAGRADQPALASSSDGL